MENRIIRILNSEIKHSNDDPQMTNADLKLVTDILRDLGFTYEHLDYDKYIEHGGNASHAFIDVYYDGGPRLFKDDRGKKYLLPNYIKGRKVSKFFCTISMNYTWMRELEDGVEPGPFQRHVSVDFNLKGSCWPYGRKQPIVCDRPEGIKWVYDYGTVKDYIPVIGQSLRKLKNYLDNGEVFPKPKK